MPDVRKTLIIGVFKNARTKNKIPTSVPQYMCGLFRKNDMEVVTTSRYLNKIGRFFDTIFTIVFYARSYDIAIVPWYNGTGSYYWQELASRLLKILNKKIVLVMHGGGIPDLLDKRPQDYLKTLQRADVVVCPSTYISSRLKKHHIASIVIENALDLSTYPFTQKQEFALNILWMRTLEPLYNPVMALQVARKLKSTNFSFKMNIAGQDNGHLKELKELQKQYDLEKEVNFCGLLNHEQKLKMAKECDLYICTNRVDNAPVSLVEMMSLGVPVVSTNVGGIPHLITDQENGSLVDDNDADAMVEKLLEIHLCPSLGRTFAKNGYLFSRRFNERKVIKKWQNLLEDLRNQEQQPLKTAAIKSIDIAERVYQKNASGKNY